jgi:hypothetical protein
LDISLKFLTFAGMKLKVCHNMRILVLLSAVVMLLSACSNDDTNTTTGSSEKQPEIRVDADIWQMMDATRAAGATTYDTDVLHTEGFTCTVYEQNTTTKYEDGDHNHIDGTAVNWSGSGWAFADGTHKWHPSDTPLDFFAYSPQTVPSYITGPTYAVSGSPASPAPSFICTLPSPQVDLKEFVWALTPGQTKETNGRTGVMMTFRHPFARIRFRLANSIKGTVTSVTIKGATGYPIKNIGKCTLSADGASLSWSELAVTADPADPEVGGVLDAYYIAIPQSFLEAGNQHSVNVTVRWSQLSDVTKTYNATASISEWQAGKSYTYTLTLNEYALKVDVDKYTEQW